MRTTIISILVSLLPAATVAFLPAPRISSSRVLAASPKPDAVSNEIDIGHAKYCADHFGECSLEDMGEMRNALHQERVSHAFADTSGLLNPAGIEEDIEHKLLENDLTFQMGLVQDKLATEHMQQVNPYSSTMNLPVLDGGLDEESSEALVICLVIAGLALLPQFV
mmetsp:Transcript_17142/g.32138  ORF Transcript_17142/g.32138 Transcript_17142/m.32138 type:complete len:166 (+) Transcript_17142:134-631(+)|eukprot:CAMPEP_0201598548 /NCGR_PEP_ID=MMETSP0492-20130828/319_1 /ASSEMBLY_ACC=CAM_ASM_000837 /TAXON_ID=420259 /ORGANISM="Thalassiosira gravida, Strain GMp14c1" /LENGTH=165 /DNA_ID=CAMNT_0048060971 /DNA_START=166 /DNA_END=663 /DNA_ORIENTATION=-